jgi:hypothetical protein
MTTSELALKTKRFTARMNRRQLCKVYEIIEELIDSQDVDRILKRKESGKEKWVSHETVKAKLEKRFPGLTK